MKYTGKRDRRKSARKSSVSAAGLHALLQNGPKLPRDYPWLVLGAVLEDLASVLPSPDIDRVRAIVRSRDNARIGELEKDWGLQSINSCSDRPPIWVTRARRLLANVIRKYADDSIESRSGRVEVAMKKFMAAEVKCTDVNQNISSSLYYSDGTPTQALFSLRNEIALVLGSLADADVTYWSRHGPGSDTKTQCGRNSKYVKYSEWPYPVTGAARSYARKLIESDERWFGALEDSYRRDLDIEMWQVIDWDWFWELVFCEEDGNRITTVPKDWSEDRPIAIEPRMNMMLQLGVDGYIRSRIKRCWGLNLNSQELNQDLSKLGSILTDADTPVTIDLSSASDSVSLKLVELLLPPEWYEYLVALRSPQGELPSGAVLRYSKISSMGNGYTWTLESLIFAALARLAVRMTHERPNYSRVAVFGDDIIVPQCSSKALLDLLSVCGFTVNISKTFLSGDVRESCGTDWVYGNAVRPIHLKSLPESYPDLFTHRNLLLRWFQVYMGFNPECTDKLFLHWVPQPLRLFGPYSEEEFGSYLFADRPSPGAYCGWRWHYKCIVSRPEKLPAESFLFGKLMHELRAKDADRCIFDKKVFVKGTVFDNCRRGRDVYCIAKRQATEWPGLESCL